MNDLTKFTNQLPKPETFDQIQIGLASPERIRSGPSAKSRSRKRSTTARSSPSATACSAPASSVP
jgi:hypothetical protein